MIPSARTSFTLPAGRSAAEPPEARGLARDDVRLLVADPHEIRHARFRDLAAHVCPGDLLVVNTSATLPAALDGRGRAGHPVVVHLSTIQDDGAVVVELRTAPDAAGPVLEAREGDVVELPLGARLRLLAPWISYAGARRGGVRLWLARISGSTDLPDYLARAGRPIRYGYVPRRWPLSAYQTVFARVPGSAEMPSAGRPFTTELVTALVSGGVVLAPITLHTGVSSLDAGEPPLPERFEVPATTAALVELTRRRRGRVVAVGTTVTRALESAVGGDGRVGEARGWTDLVLGPDRPARVVDAIVTGLHAPEASHLLLLEAVAGAGVVQRVYDAALAEGYLWHEFGDACLLAR